MATKYEQQLVSQYGTPMENYINSERGNNSGPLRGVNVDPQDVNRIVAGFKSSPYAVNNVVGAVTNPTPTYNYSDPYGARTAIEQRLGYNDATAAEQAAQKALLNYKNTTTADINKLKSNRDLSTGLEAGFEVKRGREATQQEQALADELQLAQDKRLALENKVAQEYNIYQQERANRENLLLKAIEAGAKNVNIGMTTEQLANAYTDVQNKAKEQATKDAEKQALKEMYYKLTGEWPKPMSSSRLRSKINSAAKKANLKQSEIDDLNLRIKKASLAKAEEGKVNANNFYAETTKLKNAGKTWGEIAYQLGKKYDLTPGSDYSKKLDAIMTGKAPEDTTKAQLIKEINTKIGQISDWNEQSYDDQATLIRKWGGNPSDFGL